MTSFNAPAILMPLDEYYTHYVQPKPKIPKHYGFHADKRQRQAAHLQSYKDINEEDEDKADEDVAQQVDELNSSIQDTNMNQIHFETNDFNRLYQETDEPMDQTNNNTKQVRNAEVSADSAQWRIQPNNVNRPPGAAPLVPTDAPRNQQTRQAAQRGNRWHQNQNNRRRFNRAGPNNNYNNNNSSNNNNFNRNSCQNSVHNRLGNFPGRNTQRGQLSMEQRMRNAYNAFIGPPPNNNNNNRNNINNNNNYLKQEQQQVLMKMNNHFQNGRSQLNVSAQLNSSDIQNSNFNARNQLKSYQNPNQNQGNPNAANWQLGSNSLTALINSANQIRPSMANPNAQASSLNKPTAQMGIGHNTVGRLGPPMRINLNSNVPQMNAGQPTNLTNPNAHLQRGPTGANGGIVASDSLRLADLMNMDQSSCMNLNVAEVAKNAMMLLSTVFHKPILDEDVQQELSHLQQNNGFSEEPHGLDMNISPETTELRMYHRFK